MFPPTSSRKAIRLRNAASVVGLSDLYAFLISIWIRSAPQQTHSPQVPASWVQDFRKRLLAQAEDINSMRQPTQMAKWEGNIRGAWPADEYVRLVDVQSDMVASLAQVCKLLFFPFEMS
jgi:hypothetical protein